MSMNTRARTQGRRLCAAEIPRASLQIIIKWGASTLEIKELDPPRSFSVGPEGDFLPLNAEIGETRLELIQMEADQVWLCVPSEASASVRWPEHGNIVAEEFLPSPRVALRLGGSSRTQGRRVLLPWNGRAQLHLHGFSFFFHLGEPAKLPVGAQVTFLDRTVASYFGASLGAHAGLLALFAFLVPPLGISNGEEIEQERVVLMRQYLESGAERERLREQAMDVGGGGPRSDAAPAPESTSSGKLLAQQQAAKFSSKAKQTSHTPRAPTRAETILEAQTFGTISLLTSSSFAQLQSPEFARSAALGEADQEAIGSIFGRTLGDPGGIGLALSEGPGSGIKGRGVDLGGIGPAGSWVPGGPGGFGDRRATLGPHRTRVPQVRSTGELVLSGRLAPEVIQRTVRQNYGRFRLCYERGLVRNPNLSGRIAVRFAIDSAGRVLHASVGESSLPDSEVVSCVVSAYFGLSFPAREQGIVTVVYPIAFSPE